MAQSTREKDLPDNLQQKKAILKAEKKYSQKLSNKLSAIDRKRERKLASRKEDKQREKDTWTKRILKMLEKEKIAIKMGRERKKTVFEKGREDATAYADACRVGQLEAKLRDTDELGNGPCICCPGSMFTWEELDGGHFVAKNKSRAVALDLRNINAQSKKCNSTRGGAGRYDAQLPEIDKKWGEGTVKELLFLKKLGKPKNPKEFIQEHIGEVEYLLSTKKFDVSYYVGELKRLKNKYL